jgi:hypothetical protein
MAENMMARMTKGTDKPGVDQNITRCGGAKCLFSHALEAAGSSDPDGPGTQPHPRRPDRFCVGWKTNSTSRRSGGGSSPPEEPQERRLAAPRGTNDGEALTGLERGRVTDRQLADPTERRHNGSAVA